MTAQDLMDQLLGMQSQGIDLKELELRIEHYECGQTSYPPVHHTTLVKFTDGSTQLTLSID